MNHFFRTILVLLLLAPPLQAHNDIVVYENVENHYDIDQNHEDIHHKNDSHNEKETEHHHHCTVVSLSLEFIPTIYNFEFLPLIIAKEEINFYQYIRYNSFLATIFQPPKA